MSRRSNPDFLYSDAEINRLYDRALARGDRLPGNEITFSEQSNLRALKQLATQAGASADKANKKWRDKWEKSPEGIAFYGRTGKVTAHKKGKGLGFDFGYKGRTGIGTDAEYAKLAKRFPSQMTYRTYTPEEREAALAEREAAIKRFEDAKFGNRWYHDSRDDDAYDPNEVVARATKFGGRPRGAPARDPEIFRSSISSIGPGERHGSAKGERTDAYYETRLRRRVALAQGRKTRPKQQRERAPEGRHSADSYFLRPAKYDRSGRRVNPGESFFIQNVRIQAPKLSKQALYDNLMSIQERRIRNAGKIPRKELLDFKKAVAILQTELSSRA